MYFQLVVAAEFFFLFFIIVKLLLGVGFSRTLVVPLSSTLLAPVPPATYTTSFLSLSAALYREMMRKKIYRASDAYKKKDQQLWKWKGGRLFILLTFFFLSSSDLTTTTTIKVYYFFFYIYIIFYYIIFSIHTIIYTILLIDQ